MVKVTFRQYPPEGSVFSPGAFDLQVGEEIPFKMETTVVTATVTAAHVANHGRWATITVQLPVSFPLLFDGISISEEQGS